MGLIEDIAEQLESFSKRFGPSMIVDANVVSVNEAEDTLECELPGGIIVPDVRLKSLIKEGSKFVLIPTVGSVVMIGRVRNSEEWVMISCDELDKLLLLIDNVRYEVNSNGVVIKKGDDTIRQVFDLLIDAVLETVVLNGKNPNYEKLLEAKTKAQNIFKNGT